MASSVSSQDWILPGNFLLRMLRIWLLTPILSTYPLLLQTIPGDCLTSPKPVHFTTLHQIARYGSNP
ncbi:hypothetical protein BDV11DRAFT_28140 [Aspergillus similis]